MTSKFNKFMLFLSSYAPLGIVILILNLDNWIIVVSASLGIVLPTAWLLLFLHKVRQLAGMQLSVERARRCDNEALSYIVSYLLPFLMFPTDGWQKLAAMGMFYLVLMYLYINTEMIHINPVLLLFNYRVYEIETTDGDTKCVITRSRIRSRSQIVAAVIDEGLAVEKTNAVN